MKAELGQQAGKEAGCETRRQMESHKSKSFVFSNLLTILDQQLHATKPIAATVIHKAGKGKGAKDADESTTDFIYVPDNSAISRALDMAFTLRDDYPCKKLKADVNHSGSIMAAVAAHLSEPPKKGKK